MHGVKGAGHGRREDDAGAEHAAAARASTDVGRDTLRASTQDERAAHLRSR